MRYIFLCLWTFATVAFPQSGITDHPVVPAFEVSIVRPDQADRAISFQFTGNGIVAEGVTLDTLIRMAYNLDADDVIGQPKWVSDQKFSLKAKVAAEDVPSWGKLSSEQVRLVLQGLLKDKFFLSAHWEQRTTQVLDLVLIHGDASKLDKLRSSLTSPGKSPMESYAGKIIFDNASLDILSTVLSAQLGRKVVNKTGLSGTFKFMLQFAPEQLGNSTDTVGDGSLPTLITALHDQLGLQLVQRKESIPILVVDHVEAPQAQ